MIRRDRLKKRTGGLLAYIRNKLNFTRRRDIESNCFESIWLQLHVLNCKDVLICFLYRPPNSLIEWYETFERQLEKTAELGLELIIMGDFNIDCNSTTPNIKLKSILETNGLSQLVNEPTRVAKSTATIIDHIYVNKPEYVHKVKVEKICLSDHFPICLVWKKKLTNNGTHDELIYRSQNRFEPLQFVTELQKVSWNTENLSVNESVAVLNNNILNALNKCAPLKKSETSKATRMVHLFYKELNESKRFSKTNG